VYTLKVERVNALVRSSLTVYILKVEKVTVLVMLSGVMAKPP
jgi:hypothetical protein